MQQWVSDKGLRMELAETRVKRNHFPGIHEVEADVTFKFPQPAFEGLPTGGYCCEHIDQRSFGDSTDSDHVHISASEIPGAVYFTFNDDGKLLRVQNTVAGPRAEELEQTMAMAVIASQGGKVEGQDMAAVAIKDVAERIATNDPARFAERMTDGGGFITPAESRIPPID